MHYLIRLNRLGNTHRHSENDQADRIIQCDYREKDVCDRTFRLILAHDHQSGGGSSRCSDRPEDNCRGEGKQIGTDKVQRDQRHIDEDSGDYSLQDTDDVACFPVFFSAERRNS